ncbi:thioredoxin domain-containing protein [Deinococcus sp. SDU3-2]|uniref:Thioredoxin domain-containing protein n=1 Tax=Deinococcus terrestris TaxID=2651870 RepID=A0A7X1TR11_9DEIO|nr:thioredoxin domain-containing protein [Deinococcus terrestris]MPY65832.1 thioredoxin domain-containing protein [Deinococcus terrestris]
MTRLQGNNQNRTVLVIGTLIAALLIALAVYAVRGNAGGGASGDTVDFDLEGQPVLGQADAPVTVVVFEDFKCPNCKRFEEEFLPEIRSQNLDTGKAKLVSMNFPFLAESARLPEDDSKYAAQAVECAFVQGGSEAYENLKQIIFRAQGPESALWATKSRLKELAQNVEGLDQARFATCLDNDETAAAVEADEAQARRANASGTPAVYVNGKAVESYDAETVGRAIDAATAN